MSNVAYGLLSGIVTFLFFMIQGEFAYFNIPASYIFLCPIISACLSLYLLHCRNRKLRDFILRTGLGLSSVVCLLHFAAPLISRFVERKFGVMRDNSTNHASAIALICFVSIQLIFFTIYLVVIGIKFAIKRHSEGQGDGSVVP